jgi:hypothetical protein
MDELLIDIYTGDIYTERQIDIFYSMQDINNEINGWLYY